MSGLVSRSSLDTDRIARLYYSDGLSAYEIADQFGCSPSTIYEAMDDAGLERRGEGEHQRQRDRDSAVQFRTDNKGYERWETEAFGEYAFVPVHRLAAVAWFGFDAVRDTHVHHKIPIRWLNTEWNLEPIDPGEHIQIHNRTLDRERDERGRFV
jgi:hypothetical protein